MKICNIFHSVDLDGWMSAAIVKYWWEKQPIVNNVRNEIDFIGYNYGEPIPDLSEYDMVIMCDISFPVEEMEKLRQIYQDNFIWIDHHISAIKAVDERINNYYEGLRDTKFAACELTWRYFFPDEEMPEIVRLLGMYDSFRHKGTNEETKVLEFQYGVRQCITNYKDAHVFLISSMKSPGTGIMVDIVDQILEHGKHIYKYLCIEAKQVYKNGFDIKFMIPHPEYIGEGQYKLLKFICINKERFNPVNFGIDYHKDGYEGCACFHYADGMWNFSLYNDNGEVDCSSIAKQYGGGGHMGSAGMRLTTKQFLNIINE